MKRASIIKIRRSLDPLIFIMRIPTPIRRYLYTETGPWCTLHTKTRWFIRSNRSKLTSLSLVWKLLWHSSRTHEGMHCFCFCLSQRFGTMSTLRDRMKVALDIKQSWNKVLTLKHNDWNWNMVSLIWFDMIGDKTVKFITLWAIWRCSSQQNSAAMNSWMIQDVYKDTERCDLWEKNLCLPLIWECYMMHLTMQTVWVYWILNRR